MSRHVSLRHEWRLFWVAVQFLTRLAVPARFTTPFDPGWLNECVRWFPLVGALIGAAGATVLAVASHWWPAPVAALLAVGAVVALTGAFHEDGLADTLDGLGGSVSRTRALEIMKDSRIGTYGSAALWFSLTARVAALATLLAHGLALAVVSFVCAHVVGRMAAVAVMAALPYAGDPDQAKARPLTTAVAARHVTTAAVSSVLLLIVVFVAGYIAIESFGGPGSIVPASIALESVALESTSTSTIAALRLGHLLIALAVAAAIAYAMLRWLRRRLGGYTGDTLGATEQLVEIAILIVMAGA